MPRRARQDRAGAIQLVVASGRKGERPLEGLIKEAKLAIQEAAKRAGWEVLGQLVEPERYQLIIRTERPNLSSAMQALQRDLVRRRSIFFPQRMGSMFKERFFSRCLDQDDFDSEFIRKFGVDVDVMDQPGIVSKTSESDLAEKLRDFALEYYGLKNSDLVRMAKASKEKCVLAAFIRENSAIAITWIARELSFGHPSAASRGIQQVYQNRGELLLDLSRLQIAYELQLESCSRPILPNQR